MRIQLLGPVLARDGERPVGLGVRQQRFVLAVLALEVNRLVPVQRLVDLLWPGEPPRSAHGIIHTHVSGLRAIFRDRPDVTLRRASAGYELSCDPALVDAHRFEELVTRAREADDDPGRVALLDEALGLWHGPALAGVTDEEVRVRLCRHLDETRSVASEERVDALLRLGRHHDVLDELITLSGTHPDRQRLTGQLMIALHRAGRSSEALRAYERTRQALADELGLDPGTELRRLHRAILRDDPDLAPVTPARSVPVRPAQLPADAAAFTGRGPELSRLLRAAATRAAVCAISGMAGVGKTALAVHFGHRVAGRFPDGQLFLNLRGDALDPPMTPADALGRLLRGLGLPSDRVPADEQERAAVYRSMLAGKRILVLLDNARGADQVRSLLPGTPGCLTVITSRGVLSTVDGELVRLDTLPGKDGLALLARLAGAERISAEPGPAATLVRLCGGLPLALRIVGARLAARPGWPVDALTERLRDERRRLDELRIAEQAVRAGFAVSHGILEASADPVDVRAARLFRLLGTLDWIDTSVPVAAALLDGPEPEAFAALERLVDDHLLEPVGAGRYQAHDLLRLYVRDLAEAEADREAALIRVLRCHVAAAELATRLLNPVAAYRLPAEALPDLVGLATPADATEWVAAEHANLIAITRQAAATPGAAALVVRLTAALVPPFDNRGYWADIETLRLLAAECAARLCDRSGEALARQDIGWAYVRTARSAEAITAFRQALKLWRETGGFRGEQACLNHLGLVYWQQERFAEARDCLERALAICRAHDHPGGETAALDLLGLVSQRLGRFDEAVTYHEEALAIARRVGNPVGEAAALTNLGRAHHQAGRLPQAVSCHERSLACYRQLGARFGEAESLWGLGEARHALGHLVAARADWHRAIEVLQDIGKLTEAEADSLRGQEVPKTPDVISRYG